MTLQNQKFVKHFYLYMQVTGEQSYIKVYSLNFTFDSASSNKFTVSPVKKVRYIEDSINMWAYSFVSLDQSIAEFSKATSEIFEPESIVI